MKPSHWVVAGYTFVVPYIRNSDGELKLRIITLPHRDDSSLIQI